MSRVFFTDLDLGNQFPAILAAAGLTVERHCDHFPPTCPDDEWLRAIGSRGWIVVTHNSRIRYTPNELASVMEHEIALLVVVGKASYPDIARSFVATHRRIDAFLARHRPPFIAKVYRPAPGDLARRPDAPGRIELWHPCPAPRGGGSAGP